MFGQGLRYFVDNLGPRANRFDIYLHLVIISHYTYSRLVCWRFLCQVLHTSLRSHKERASDTGWANRFLWVVATTPDVQAPPFLAPCSTTRLPPSRGPWLCAPASRRVCHSRSAP